MTKILLVNPVIIVNIKSRRVHLSVFKFFISQSGYIHLYNKRQVGKHFEILKAVDFYGF